MFDAEKILRDERANLVHQLSELGANDDGQLRDDVSYGEGFADAAAEGTYGTCAECGKKISRARIEFRPESIYCVDCKAKS